jgi:sugar lactone lactonase YvrE
VLIDAGPGGTPDGMRCDVDGNLWCGWGMGNEALDGVHVFAPDGARIGHIALPERCANVCFAGSSATAVHGRGRRAADLISRDRPTQTAYRKDCAAATSEEALILGERSRSS